MGMQLASAIAVKFSNSYALRSALIRNPPTKMDILLEMSCVSWSWDAQCRDLQHEA